MILPPTDSDFKNRLSAKFYERTIRQFAAAKIAVFQYATVGVFAFLIAGFWTLQVQSPQFYGEQARHNSIKSMPILAARGRILDRDGRVIVDNHSSFTLMLARELLVKEDLKPIAVGLELDYGELVARIERVKARPKYVPIVLKENLTLADLAFVDSHRDFFPELLLIQSQHRLYPRDGMLAHVIGYTGEISDAELDSPELAKYTVGDVIGKVGIERQYNSLLMGTDGQRQVVVDNRGQVRQVLRTQPAIAGKDLQLTVDLDLQAVAELAMDGRNGAVVALDPHTGEVLAMVSRPAFDPNQFTGRILEGEWKAMAGNPDHPMMNRAIQAQLAPGSTFKPTMALAALETGTIDDKLTVRCAGGASFYGHYYHCDLKSGHGTISLHRAIVQSCNTYFYTAGNRLGIERIALYANRFGFGHKTGIDLPNEVEGVVPSAKWKLRNFRQPWYAGETIPVAIGQGALTVTPLQLARAIGGISLGGEWHRPHLVQAPAKPEDTVRWGLQPENVKQVIDGMYGVVNEGGTGGRAQLPDVEVCGKTGTAQVASADMAKRSGGRNMKDNGWFVGFAPCRAPEIVVVALSEHGGQGAWSAPIVRSVMRAYFDKKARRRALEQPKKLAEAWTAGVPPVPVAAPEK